MGGRLIDQNTSHIDRNQERIVKKCGHQRKIKLHAKRRTFTMLLPTKLKNFTLFFSERHKEVGNFSGTSDALCYKKTHLSLPPRHKHRKLHGDLKAGRDPKF